MKRREVECSVPGGSCAEALKPPEEQQCGNIVCGTWNAGNWSEVSSQRNIPPPRFIPIPPQFLPSSISILPRFLPNSASMPSQFCRLNFTLLYGINPLPSYFHWGICFSKTWSNFCFNWYDSISNVQIVALIQLFSQSNRIMFHIFKSSKNGLANALASQWENGRFGSFITPFILSKTHYIKTLFIRCY